MAEKKHKTFRRKTGKKTVRKNGKRGGGCGCSQKANPFFGGNNLSFDNRYVIPFKSNNDVIQDPLAPGNIINPRLSGGSTGRKKTRSKRQKKMRGGDSFDNDTLLGSRYLMNMVSAFGTIPGATFSANAITGTGNVGGPVVSPGITARSGIV